MCYINLLKKIEGLFLAVTKLCYVNLYKMEQQISMEPHIWFPTVNL